MHLTAKPELLIGVANHFYKGVKDAFLLLCLDSAKLTAEVRSHTISIRVDCRRLTSFLEIKLRHSHIP